MEVQTILHASFTAFFRLENNCADLVDDFKKKYPTMRFSSTLDRRDIYIGYRWKFTFKTVAEMNRFIREYNIKNDKCESSSSS